MLECPDLQSQSWTAPREGKILSAHLFVQNTSYSHLLLYCMTALLIRTSSPIAADSLCLLCAIWVSL